jgi:hypothetical protein
LLNLSIDEELLNLPIDEELLNLPIDEELLNLSIDEELLNLPIDEELLNLPIDEELLNLPIDKESLSIKSPILIFLFLFSSMDLERLLIFGWKEHSWSYCIYLDSLSFNIISLLLSSFSLTEFRIVYLPTREIIWELIELIVREVLDKGLAAGR